MTLYAIYTPARQELATERAITDLGIRAECAKRVDLIRQGKRRWPDAVISSYLPNYVFAWLTPQGWHEVHKLKTARDLMAIGAGPERGVVSFLARVNADYRQRMDMIEAGERLAAYDPGDLLTVMTGSFAGQLASFTRMVETANDIFPQIEAAMSIMGRVVNVRLDPLTVCKSA